VFVVAFLLFWRSIFGGGDAKLVAATALLVGSRDLFDFFLIMSVCGGGLGLAILARDRSYARRRHTSQVATGLPSHWMDPALPPARPTVPYGVAIASAAVVILVLRPVL
jgi:prepilin peptidase CpaA